jgi:hypothetical protein
MTPTDRPLVISVPEPRTLDLIFTPDQRAVLFQTYEVVETTPEDFAALPDAVLNRAKYIIGQPAISEQVFAKMTALRCVLNVESNLINNMPY